MEIDNEVQAILNEDSFSASEIQQRMDELQDWLLAKGWTKDNVTMMADAGIDLKWDNTGYTLSLTLMDDGKIFVQFYKPVEYSKNFTADQFMSMQVPDLLAFLRKWQPVNIFEESKNESDAPMFTFDDLPKEVEEFLYDDKNYSIIPEIQEFIENKEDQQFEANEVPDLMEQIRDFALALAEKDLMDSDVYDEINNAIDRFLEENADYFNESKAKHEFFDPEDPDCERPMSCYGGRKFKHNRFGELTYNKDQDTFFDNDGDAYDADAIDFAELELLPESLNAAEKPLQELKQDIKEWAIKMLTDTIQGSEPGRYYKDIIATVNTLHDLDNYISLINDYEASRIEDSRIEPNALDEINAWYDNAIKVKKEKISEIISK